MSFDPWTLGFQAVNVLLLVWLLQRFFWTPVAAMIAQRQAQAAEVFDEAATKEAEVEAALDDIATTRAGMADEREALLAAARVEGEVAGKALLAAAKVEIEALHDTAKAARVRAAATLKETASHDAQTLAVTIAGLLLEHHESEGFLAGLVRTLAALPGPERGALAGAQLEVVSATEVDTAAQARITKALGTVLETPPTLSFRTDRALIAGIELHGTHVTLRNSWRTDLERITQAMADAA